MISPPCLHEPVTCFANCLEKFIWGKEMKPKHINNRVGALLYSKYELVAFGKGEKLAPFCRTVKLNEGG